MHAIYGASEYKNRLELTPANVLGRVLQFRRYRVKNPGQTYLESMYESTIVKVADCRNIFFGIDTSARYFEAETAIKTELDGADDADDEMHQNELLADDDNADMPVVNLERQEENGADLERVQEALLSAGFAIERNSNDNANDKQNNKSLPDYIRLWQ
ncbi:hypothetical protein R1sor_013955 [Riccia sorocarpa]|uniref:Uncharacterized protein n=1 Tax=Riccia sorocarpa TaxID=122646 RepID=A0ABD3H9Z3_9MARC